MRSHLMRRALSGAAIGVFGLLGQAQAEVLDFEDVTPNIFFSGESFAQSSFTFTQQGDFGVVGADFLVAQPPLGNTTQFYSGLNDSAVMLTRADGIAFNLFGFDAGFVAPVPQDPGVVAGRIVLMAETATGGSLFSSWEFGASDADGNFSFEHFGGGLGAFRNLVSVTFMACVYDDTDVCQNPMQNLAQYALDNVDVTAVPEPSTYALMALGLAGVVACGRRRARS